MPQNTTKTLGFKKIIVYKAPPGGGGVNHIWLVAYIKLKEFDTEFGHSDLLPVYESNFANISRNTEQILVRFNQNYLQVESFQIHVTGKSKTADGCCY